MTDEPQIEVPLSAPTFPEGDYAIAECLGHRTLIGRCAEVERFGAKMLQIEPIFQNALLPPIFVGGGSLYAFTPCSAETAFKNAPKHSYQLPSSLSATLDVPQIEIRPSRYDGDDGDDGDEVEF